MLALAFSVRSLFCCLALLWKTEPAALSTTTHTAQIRLAFLWSALVNLGKQLSLILC